MFLRGVCACIWMCMCSQFNNVNSRAYGAITVLSDVLLARSPQDNNINIHNVFH